MITRIMETIQSRFNRAGSCRFDEKKCEAGIEALGFYHEKMMWDRGDESGDSAAGFRSPWTLVRWFTSIPPRINRLVSNVAARPTRWRSSTLAKSIRPGQPNKLVNNWG